MKHNLQNFSKTLLLMLLFCLPMTWLHASMSSAETKGFYKKLPPATMTIVKTDEICPNNGTIGITLDDVPATASVLYEYWNNATPNSVVSSSTGIIGLPAGTYTVRAQITDGGSTQTLSQQVTIAKIYKPILANSTVKKVLCAGASTGEIKVTTTQGTPVNYAIVSAPAAYTNPLPFSQTSDTFTGLPVGVYQIRVYDVCGLYNTITVTVDVQVSYYDQIMYYRPTTNCQANLIHTFFAVVNGGLLKYPLTIETTVTEMSSGNVVYYGNNNYTGTATPGTSPSVTEPITFNNPNFTFPLSITSNVTDACGVTTTVTRIIRNNIRLEAICPPALGFGWDISTFQNVHNSDTNPHAVFPVTVVWVNSTNPADTGSQTSSTRTGTVTGLTAGATYNVTITDACGKIRTSSVTISGSAPNVGQTAFVNVLPSCDTGRWLAQFGTASGGNNKYIGDITVVSSPPGSGVANGTSWGGGASFNMWVFRAGGSLIRGEWVFRVTMDCVVDTITINAPGHGAELYNADITSSGTCNSANVTIDWGFIREGVAIPWPTLVYAPSVTKISLRDVTLPASAPSTFVFQESNTFLNVPNGTYDVIVNLISTGSQCLNKVIGRITVTSPGPQIQSPFGFQCLDGANAGGFGVLVQATGVGALSYAITAIGGVPVASPVWQASNEFTGLAARTYTITVRDNCASTSTIFDTEAIIIPRVRNTTLCPGQTGSLYAPFVPSFTYQWYKDGVMLSDGGNISGSNTYRLIFTPFTAADNNATYSVNISYGDCINRQYSIVINNTPPNSGADYNSPDICADTLTAPIDLRTYLSSDAQATGVWSQVSGTGGTLNDYMFNPAGINPTSEPFVFKYTTTGGCVVDEAVITLNIKQCVCYENPNTTGVATDSKMGITLLKRAGADEVDNWPMVRKSAHLVLESNTKGFVVTRVTTAGLAGITAPQEGMMVYDTTAKCLKLYSDGVWSCFSTPTCP